MPSRSKRVSKRSPRKSRNKRIKRNTSPRKRNKSRRAQSPYRAIGVGVLGVDEVSVNLVEEEEYADGYDHNISSGPTVPFFTCSSDQFSLPFTFISKAPTLLTLTFDNNTRVDFCHGLPVPNHIDYSKSHAKHNMWADASDSSKKDIRGKGINNVNPHDLVRGYVKGTTVQKYYSVSAHQDDLHLQIWHNGKKTPTQLNKIPPESTCYGIDVGRGHPVKDTDLTDMGTYDKSGNHLGAVVIHSTAIHSKIPSGNASYLEITKDSLHFKTIPNKSPPQNIEKDIRSIFSDSHADIMSLLRDNNCENFWKLCEFWATKKFRGFYYGNKALYDKEQKEAIVLDGFQTHNFMQFCDEYFEAKGYIICEHPPQNSHVFFFGDLHCSVGSLAKILLTLKDKEVISANGVVQTGYSLISGGDLIDRGYLGVSCVLLIYFVLIQTQEADDSGYVGICRGNHEDCQVASAYGFNEEIGVRRNKTNS